ncbi:lipopolysaccharide heptosyltransferase II [Thermodesulfobacteriota bacterium]
MKPKSNKPSRIVVRGTNWVGDTVISLPALREVRRIFPEATIAVWVPKVLEDLIWATGIADEVITFDSDFGGPLRRPFKMRGILASRRFDLAILLQNAFESAFTAWLARVPLRAGYPTDMRGPLLNIKVPQTVQTRQQHQVFYYFAITDHLARHFLGERLPREGDPNCSIAIPQDHMDKAGDLLTEEAGQMAGCVFCLCPGSVNSDAKRWPAVFYARLADMLIADMDARIVFLGSSGERGLIDGIVSQMQRPGALNLAGKSDMLASMAMMSLAAMVISNDTGSAHLAVAASARVLTIFGPTSPGATAPFGPSAGIIQGTASCAPCRHFACPYPDHMCMTRVKPEAILERIREIMSGDEAPTCGVFRGK